MGKGIGWVYKHNQSKYPYPETNTLYVSLLTYMDNKNHFLNEYMGEPNQYLVHTKTFLSLNNNNNLDKSLKIDNKYFCKPREM